LRVELPPLGPRARLSIEIAGDPERELEAAVLELFAVGVDVERANGPRDAVWRKRERRMQAGLSFDELPAGHWIARLVPTGPGPDAGEERSFCEEIFELELRPGASENVLLALRRGGWLRILPFAMGGAGTTTSWRMRDSTGALVSVRFVQRRNLATLPVTELAFDAELETPAALPPGDYLLEVEAVSRNALARSFRIEAGRTTTLEAVSAR
jgi:hypothetical protein